VKVFKLDLTKSLKGSMVEVKEVEKLHDETLASSIVKE
jgi:hypothetical protein